MAEHTIRIHTEQFTDEDLSRISQLIDDEFTAIIEKKAFASIGVGPMDAEVKTGESVHGDEYGYLLVNDQIQSIAFIRRNDANHYELMLSSFY